MVVHGTDQDDPRLAAARVRWRAAGDRIWAVATADGPGYRQTVATVAPLLDELRLCTGTTADLLDLDEDPAPLITRLPGETGVALGRQPSLLAAACSIRADELAGVEAARRRVARIDAARAAGQAWVLLEDTPGRRVEMHLDTGRTLVATADPYADPTPYGVTEVVLDPSSGEVLAGSPSREDAFTTREAWVAECERLRADLGSRLDTRSDAGSDR